MCFALTSASDNARGARFKGDTTGSIREPINKGGYEIGKKALIGGIGDETTQTKHRTTKCSDASSCGEQESSMG